MPVAYLLVEPKGKSMMNVSVTQRKSRCSFRLRDVICPDRLQVLQQIAADLEVAGEVVFLSDRGTDRDRFAIIEVEGIASPLIVPVERLQLGETARVE